MSKIHNVPHFCIVISSCCICCFLMQPGVATTRDPATRILLCVLTPCAPSITLMPSIEKRSAAVSGLTTDTCKNTLVWTAAGQNACWKAASDPVTLASTPSHLGSKKTPAVASAMPARPWKCVKRVVLSVDASRHSASLLAVLLHKERLHTR